MREFILALLITMIMIAPVLAKNGFNEYGYNYKARIFVGTGGQWCLSEGNDYYCLGLRSNDHLVMKWSKAWDKARFHNEEWTCDAWVSNHWNGMIPGGSGISWYYKRY